MGRKKQHLDCDDFPLKVEKQQIKTRRGDPVATSESNEVAEDVCERLNEDACRKHEDNWTL